MKHRRLVAGICIFGLSLTALSAWAVARVDRNTEERLLEVQTLQAATVLSTALMLIQQPMQAALDVQAATGPDVDVPAFRRAMTEIVGDSEEDFFVSASLWREGSSDYHAVASVGENPARDPQSPDLQGLLRRAFESPTSVVERLDVGEHSRIAYALADPETGLAVYTERALPADRRAPVDRDSAFADIDYAIYLGDRTEFEDLSTTDVDPADLPLTGLTFRTEVPFGDTVLTLVTTPRRHLGSSLSQWLPLIVVVGGVLLTLAAALVARQLVRARSRAEAGAETISALYRRVEVLYGEQRDLSVRLQRALLPQASPEIPGIESSAAYVAGGQGVDIGGDWYSLISIDDDRFAFVVGDVSGHGIDAVAVMARARFTLRAYLMDGNSPGAALFKSSRQFDITLDDHIITAIVGIGDRRTGEIVVANAGHPPPLLAKASGAEFVTTSVGPPLGIGPSTYQETAFTMPTDSTLILYTDGLIERRSEGIDIGMRRLADTASPAAQEPLETLIAQLLTTLHDESAADDIAVLALRRVSSVKPQPSCDIGVDR